jgi:hypothetical protein
MGHWIFRRITYVERSILPLLSYGKKTNSRSVAEFAAGLFSGMRASIG